MLHMLLPKSSKFCSNADFFFAHIFDHINMNLLNQMINCMELSLPELCISQEDAYIM